MTKIGKNIEQAAEWLNSGEVIGIPTETVYGLAGNALNEDSILKIFKVKNRPFFDPLIVHVADLNSARKFVKEIPDLAEKLFEKFSPGPLTILLERNHFIPDLVTAGSEKVAIRIPNHPLTLELLNKIDFPLAAPSANPFGYVSPTSATHVAEQLGNQIEYILDGGDSTVGLESTIVSVTSNVIKVHRLGGISVEDLKTVCNNIELEINVSSNPQAPGQLKSHYATRTPLIIIPSDDDSIITEKNSAYIGFNKKTNLFPSEHQYLLAPDASLETAAKNLFATMRRLDKLNYKFIYTSLLPEVGLGCAINDRLKRAAS